VFVYLDNEERLVAVTDHPYIKKGEFALLRCNSVSEIGAFLDWGLVKELFCPFRFELSDDQVFNNIQNYGNTTAASIPIALSEAHQQGKVKAGDTVVLAAFGSGFTWGSVIIKW
jgi:hypothetical protein